MRLFGSERIAKMMDRMGHKEGEVIQHSMITKSIERAQKKVEENNFGIRKRLLEFDDVMNSQRTAIYNRRKNALFGDKLDLDIDNMIYDICNTTVVNSQQNSDFEDFNYNVITSFGIESPFNEKEFLEKEGERLTFTPIFIEAIAKALRDYPLVNSSIDGDNIIIKSNINIGMATALPSGNLIVPVIKNADQLNLVGLAKTVNDLSLIHI